MLVGFVAAVVLAGRGQPGDGSRWRPALIGVCRAAEEAAEGRRDRARAAFFDVHDDLHELIAAAGGSEGAGLAEAKFRVERAFRSPEEPVTEWLRSLRDVVRSTGVGAGDDPGSCP